MGERQSKPCCSSGDLAAPPLKRGHDGLQITKSHSSVTSGHSRLVASSQCAVRERYEVGAQPLGIGTSGSVHKCWHRVTGAAYAVKTISKVRVKDVDHLKREIAIMAMLDHPNIVKLIETFEDRRSIYLVMELCAGGELLDALAQVNQFSEVQAATLMRQILRGIYYMHESNTCHGDLKPDNIMFSTQGSIGASILKIIDFGLSCRLGEASHRRAKGSTPYYTAPEALSGHCSKEGDLWSCGAIMFTMLCGRPPFSGETKEDVIFSIRRGSFSFPRGRISENGQDLVRKLMKLNPCKRYSAEQALNHVWLQERVLPEDEVELPSDFIENLREFRQAGQMKKLVLNIIASQLTETQIKSLRQTFTRLDKNQDGLLTAAEIKEGLKEVDVPPDLHDILEGIDSDNRGQIDYTEFVAASLQRKYYSQEDVCWAAFNMVDRDGDGKISINELRKVANSGTIAEELQRTTGPLGWKKLSMCSQRLGMSTLQNIMAELDLNGDGFIDFKEFKSLVQDSHVRRSSKEIPRQGMRPTQRISKHTQYMELSAGRHARLRSLSL